MNLMAFRLHQGCSRKLRQGLERAAAPAVARRRLLTVCMQTVELPAKGERYWVLIACLLLRWMKLMAFMPAG